MIIQKDENLFLNWPLMSSIVVYCIFSLHDIAYQEVPYLTKSVYAYLNKCWFDLFSFYTYMPLFILISHSNKLTRGVVSDNDAILTIVITFNHFHFPKLLLQMSTYQCLYHVWYLYLCSVSYLAAKLIFHLIGYNK
jgi:hypothetical protein